MKKCACAIKHTHFFEKFPFSLSLWAKPRICQKPRNAPGLRYCGFGARHDSKNGKGSTRLFIQRYKVNEQAL